MKTDGEQGTKGECVRSASPISAPLRRFVNFSISPYSPWQKTSGAPVLAVSAHMNDPKIMNGSALAARMRQAMKETMSHIAHSGARVPVLAAILVGDSPASQSYVRMKIKACEAIGMGSRFVPLSVDTSTFELLRVIYHLNEDPDIDGILLQHPVPRQIDERACFDQIRSDKDVDGVSSSNFGRICAGLRAHEPCTPAGILRLLDYHSVDLPGKNAVVVGASDILCRPMSMMLLNRQCTVTICHIKTRDLAAQLSDADIVVVGVGSPRLIKGEWIKEGAVIVDAGCNEGNIGDVDFDACYRKASLITPVPGGVGPMTIAMLLLHTLQSALGKYAPKVHRVSIQPQPWNARVAVGNSL